VDIAAIERPILLQFTLMTMEVHPHDDGQAPGRRDWGSFGPEKDANLLSISTIQAVDELAARDGRTIAKLLRTYCRSAGLTQPVLAEEAGPEPGRPPTRSDDCCDPSA
jgi:hypothetical protein